VLKTLLMTLNSLAIIPPLLVTLVTLRISDSFNATFDTASFTTLFDSLLDLAHLRNVLGGAKLLLQRVQDLVAVGDERLVGVLENLIVGSEAPGWMSRSCVAAGAGSLGEKAGFALH
jgi:hypothetical protein